MIYRTLKITHIELDSPEPMPVYIHHLPEYVGDFLKISGYP